MATAFRPSLLRSAMPQRANGLVRSALQSTQRATFQTSSVRALLPPLPQTVKGTLNDAAPVPHAHPVHGSYHWTTERLVSVAIVPATLIPFAAGVGNPILDSSLIGLTILHTYIGFESVITDYLPTWRVPIARKVFEWGNVLAALVVGYGFYEFETNDVGLTEAIKKIWTA